MLLFGLVKSRVINRYLHNNYFKEDKKIGNPYWQRQEHGSSKRAAFRQRCGDYAYGRLDKVSFKLFYN